jgi:hypothetical protein
MFRTIVSGVLALAAISALATSVPATSPTAAHRGPAARRISPAAEQQQTVGRKCSAVPISRMRLVGQKSWPTIPIRDEITCITCSTQGNTNGNTQGNTTNGANGTNGTIGTGGTGGTNISVSNAGGGNPQYRWTVK